MGPTSPSRWEWSFPAADQKVQVDEVDIDAYLVEELYEGPGDPEAALGISAAGTASSYPTALEAPTSCRP